MCWKGIARPHQEVKGSYMVKSLEKLRLQTKLKQKKLHGLQKVFASGSTVGKISPTTSVIREPKKSEVRVRKSDIAKFGTKDARDTDLSNTQKIGPQNK